MDFRNGDEPAMADVEAAIAEAGHAPEAPAMEAGGRPAVAMTEKSDAGSADLVEQLGAAALQGALTCLRITARGVSAVKGTRPVTNSYKMMPSE